MKISKKILDELIEVNREVWQVKSVTIKHCLDKCREIGHENKIDSILCERLCGLISTYVRCNTTNETIYKAIEMLGIEIE